MAAPVRSAVAASAARFGDRASSARRGRGSWSPTPPRCCRKSWTSWARDGQRVAKLRPRQIVDG
eukprot:scaffold16944_cov60-Phaeocystis_antarctica.AAC.3